MAYLLAKTHGLDDECHAILEASGITEDQIKLPKIGRVTSTPTVVAPTFENNWPVKSSGTSSFEKALFADGGEPDVIQHDQVDEEFVNGETETHVNGHLNDHEDEDAAGWDMGEASVAEVEDDYVNVEAVDAGTSGIASSEAEIWVRNSPVAADHVAAGSFESAMNLLNRQIGAVNFAPLERRFFEIHQASRTFLPANASLPPLVNHVRRTLKETESKRLLPFITRDIESIVGSDIVAGKAFMQKNLLEEGVGAFKNALHDLMVNVATSQTEVEEVFILYFVSILHD